MKYHVYVTEACRYGFDIEAESYDEALEAAYGRYETIDPYEKYKYENFDVDIEVREAE